MTQWAVKAVDAETTDGAPETDPARPVVVTTERGGVFFGYLDSIGNRLDSVVLKKCRVCVYWSVNVHGFIGLAASGPDRESRVSPAAPVAELRGVTGIFDCAPGAVTAWEAGSWHG